MAEGETPPFLAHRPPTGRWRWHPGRPWWRRVLALAFGPCGHITHRPQDCVATFQMNDPAERDYPWAVRRSPERDDTDPVNLAAGHVPRGGETACQACGDEWPCKPWLRGRVRRLAEVIADRDRTVEALNRRAQVAESRAEKAERAMRTFTGWSRRQTDLHADVVFGPVHKLEVQATRTPDGSYVRLWLHELERDGRTLAIVLDDDQAAAVVVEVEAAAPPPPPSCDWCDARGHTFNDCPEWAPRECPGCGADLDDATAQHHPYCQDGDPALRRSPDTEGAS